MPNSKDALQGLTCPKCGGVILIPEGDVIVQCPYCEMRSAVHGEHGIHRYQVPCRINSQQATGAMVNFLGSNMAIAWGAKGQARITEAFLAYVPFWAGWGRVVSWVFGEKQVGSGDSRRYEPREVKVASDMSWNGAACDVGEFGVNQVPLTDLQLEAYNADNLHRAGLVFEPVGSSTEALAAAEKEFQNRVRSQAGLDRVSQAFVRIVRPRQGVVYFPLWVIRYQFRGRTYQVVVDGYSGKVLYGKAPGNTIYRAAILVAGMAAGAFITIDIPALMLSASSGNSHDSPGGILIAALVFGLGLMYAAFRGFRYGEEYEYRFGPKPASSFMGGGTTQQISDVINILEKFR